MCTSMQKRFKRAKKKRWGARETWEDPQVSIQMDETLFTWKRSALKKLLKMDFPLPVGQRRYTSPRFPDPAHLPCATAPRKWDEANMLGVAKLASARKSILVFRTMQGSGVLLRAASWIDWDRTAWCHLHLTWLLSTVRVSVRVARGSGELARTRETARDSSYTHTNTPSDGRTSVAASYQRRAVLPGLEKTHTAAMCLVSTHILKETKWKCHVTCRARHARSSERVLSQVVFRELNWNKRKKKRSRGSSVPKRLYMEQGAHSCRDIFFFSLFLIVFHIDPPSNK